VIRRLFERRPRATRLGAYGGDRPEVRALVPRGARRVLDLGCSMGAVGEALKRGGDVEVVGVESDPAFAEEARVRLDTVVEADIEELLARADPGLGSFDCILAADSLEHLRDPWTALARAAGLLEANGTAVVSLPNVRFFETFWQLGARGTWPRRGDGIFDRSHLRWFALRDARELLEGAGLEVTQVRPLIRIRPKGSRVDPWFAWLARTPLRELFAFQYVLQGRAARVPVPPVS
jgi:2-polyprenyl-3-methyl-5-hydroxy-6-metoxy-1,4-benzoquinol methylase